MYPPRFPMTLHSTCGVNCITKQAVAWHLQPYYSRHHRARVYANTYLKQILKVIRKLDHPYKVIFH